MKRYKEVPHTADMAVQIYGRSVAELFENAAFAIFDQMADLAGLSGGETAEVNVDAPDTESLLVAWLNELLYLSFNRDLLFYGFRVISMEKNKLRAEATGQNLEENRARINVEIKAATYHDVRIKKRDHGYEVTVVFDV
ncbi:MAG: archease [Candidatus Omnitrophica bacterium]|nr:archease [Candidatus Omnitrophota bacterium]